MLDVEYIMSTGYYLIVDRSQDNTFIIHVGESLTDSKCVDKIKIIYEKGFIKLYINNETDHRLIRECKEYDLFIKCCINYVDSLTHKCNIGTNLVFEKIENKLINYVGDSK